MTAVWTAPTRSVSRITETLSKMHPSSAEPIRKSICFFYFFLLAKVATEPRPCKPGEFVKEAAPGASVTSFEQPVDHVSNKVEGLAW